MGIRGALHHRSASRWAWAHAWQPGTTALSVPAIQRGTRRRRGGHTRSARPGHRTPASRDRSGTIQPPPPPSPAISNWGASAKLSSPKDNAVWFQTALTHSLQKHSHSNTATHAPQTTLPLPLANGPIRPQTIALQTSTAGSIIASPVAQTPRRAALLVALLPSQYHCYAIIGAPSASCDEVPAGSPPNTARTRR
jgi:hypothetical protein